MPRPEREQLILDVAGQTFARDGYHAASMAAIAELADVSKPMVYAYFGSKEELYVAYINRMGRELLDRLMRAIGEDDPPIVRLRTRVAEFLAFVEENRDGWRVLFTEMSSSRPLAEEVAELRRQIAAAISRMVKSSVSADANLPPAAIDAIGHAIVGAGESLANWWLEHPEVPREAVADWYGGLVQAAVTAVVGRRPSSTG
ncbi:MAG: TetR/AcrR family transcriptional regulator [Solirubrobacteraceae bacterium]